MIKIICAIFAIAIKSLEIYLSNSNLLMEKSAIYFKLLAQKKEINKQTANILFYKNQVFVL